MRLSRSYLSACVLSLGLGVAACSADDPNTPSATTAETPVAATVVSPVIEPWGYPLDAFDQATKPGDDFFRFANGGWLDATPIPSDRSGTGFSIVMRDRNEVRMAEIISGLQSADQVEGCLLYTSPSPRDQRGSRMPSSA